MGDVTVNAIYGQWYMHRHPLTRSYRRNDTYWILSIACERSDSEELKLGQDDVLSLVSRYHHWRRENDRPISVRDARRRVARVLEALNNEPHVHVVLPPEPVRFHQETALPHHGRSLELAHQVMALDRQLLSWCRQHRRRDAWLLVLAVSLITRLGMGERVVISTLAQLTQRHLDHQWLAIPAQPDEPIEDGGKYRIRLPAACWVPMRAILNQARHASEGEWILAVPSKQVPTTRKARETELRKRLQQATRQGIQDLQSHGESQVWSQITSWAKIARAGPHVPVLRGVPPVWATLLRRYPLPTCTPMPLSRTSGTNYHQPGDILGRLRPSYKLPALPSLPEQTQPPGVYTLDVTQLPDDWPRQTKNTINQFMAEVSQLAPRRVHAKKWSAPLRSLLLHYESIVIQLLGHQGSYPQWLLHWAYHLLHVQQNTISTVRTYLSRITPLPLIMHEASLDITEWDDHTVEDLYFEAVSGKSWSAGTQRAFSQALRQFIHFCQDHGMLEDVSPPIIEGGNDLSTLRTRIITPYHFSTLWHGLTQQTPVGESRQQHALVLALGFYGGLRASEVLSLTLNDVVVGDNENSRTCWIEVLGGKTPAARRRVALHIMAPPSVIYVMSTWIEWRRHSCSGSLDEIALFGPSGNPMAYTRQALITPVITCMRWVIGDGTDFHGLRHAAVSWTLLRLHAAMNPQFADKLYHKGHWMFSSHALESLRCHFCGAEGDDTVARGTLLLQVSKWIGHNEPGTMLQHYAHVLGLIHSDYL